MKKINCIVYILLFSSCSTLNKTLLYTSASGAIAGGVIGRGLSPDRQSDNFNTALGAITGAITSSIIGYFLYSDANPAIKLKTSSLKNENPLSPLRDQSYSNDKLSITPKLYSVGSKEYLKFAKGTPDHVKKNAKKQFYKRYKTQGYLMQKNNKVYQIPPMDITEMGID